MGASSRNLGHCTSAAVVREAKQVFKIQQMCHATLASGQAYWSMMRTAGAVLHNRDMRADTMQALQIFGVIAGFAQAAVSAQAFAPTH